MDEITNFGRDPTLKLSSTWLSLETWAGGSSDPERVKLASLVTCDSVTACQSLITLHISASFITVWSSSLSVSTEVSLGQDQLETIFLQIFGWPGLLERCDVS